MSKPAHAAAAGAAVVGAALLLGCSATEQIDLTAHLDRAVVDLQLLQTPLAELARDNASGWFDPRVSAWQGQQWPLPEGYAAAMRNRAKVEFILLRTRDTHQLTFECVELARVQGRVPALVVTVNGAALPPRRLNAEDDTYTVSIPGRLLRPALNDIDFQYVQVERGSGVVIGYANDGPLACRNMALDGGGGTAARHSSAAVVPEDVMAGLRDSAGNLRIPAGTRLSFLVRVRPGSRLLLEGLGPLGDRTADDEATLGVFAAIELESPPGRQVLVDGVPTATRRLDLAIDTHDDQFAVLSLAADYNSAGVRLAQATLTHPALPEPALQACSDCSVVLVSLDTLRADRLGAYGNDRALTPNLDALAADAVVFERHRSNASSTLPSHASMFSGLYPPRHGASRLRGQAIGASARLLAEALKETGVPTVAFTSGGQVSPQWGFDRGFDIYETDPGNLSHEARFTHQVQKARSWLESRPRRPFFLFLHTYEVHAPYTPRHADRDLLGPAYSGTLRQYNVDTAELQAALDGSRQFDDADVAHIRSLYDAEVMNVDRGIGELVELLRAHDLYDRTLLLVTSDHGEDFGEAGAVGWHSHTLEDVLLSVPMLMKLPQQRLAGTRIASLSTGADLAPTILESFGLAATPGLDGVSLFRYLLGPAPARIVLAQRDGLPDPQIAAITGRWKFFANTGELRDRHDPSALAGDPAARLLQAYVDDYLEIAAQQLSSRSMTLDPELQEQLRSLGYIQ